MVERYSNGRECFCVPDFWSVVLDVEVAFRFIYAEVRVRCDFTLRERKTQRIGNDGLSSRRKPSRTCMKLTPNLQKLLER